MDFKRQEGESERAYYSRVSTEIKLAVRKRVEALIDYQQGKASIKELEERLVGLFKSKKAPAAPPEAAPEPPAAT